MSFLALQWSLVFIPPTPPTPPPSDVQNVAVKILVTVRGIRPFLLPSESFRAAVLGLFLLGFLWWVGGEEVKEGID